MSSVWFRRLGFPGGVHGASVVVLTVVRMWLDAAVRLKAEADQLYDDGLYARLAQSIRAANGSAHSTN